MKDWEVAKLEERGGTGRFDLQAQESALRRKLVTLQYIARYAVSAILLLAVSEVELAEVK